MALRMWPFGKYSEPPVWIQGLTIVVMIILQSMCVCVGDGWLWDPDAWWKWSRMWKSDAEVEAEERSKQARCCANDRDEWRKWARKHNLIPQKSTRLRISLSVRQLKYELLSRARSLADRVPDNRSAGSRYDPPFLRLPLELREQIYKLYVQEWSSARLELWGRYNPGIPIPPHEPPITQVSKLIRTEALTVFYQTARFPLIIHLENPHTNPGPPYTAVDWYEYLGPSKLCLIRHLELYICMRNSTGFRTRDSIVFNVDFEPDGNRVYWAYTHPLYKVVDGVMLIAPHEEEFMNGLLQKFRSVAHHLGSTGPVSARDIYMFTV